MSYKGWLIYVNMIFVELWGDSLWLELCWYETWWVKSYVETCWLKLWWVMSIWVELRWDMSNLFMLSECSYLETKPWLKRLYAKALKDANVRKLENTNFRSLTQKVTYFQAHWLRKWSPYTTTSPWKLYPYKS